MSIIVLTRNRDTCSNRFQFMIGLIIGDHVKIPKGSDIQLELGQKLKTVMGVGGRACFQIAVRVYGNIWPF